VVDKGMMGLEPLATLRHESLLHQRNTANRISRFWH